MLNKKSLAALAAATASLFATQAHAATIDFTEAEFGGDGVAAADEYVGLGIRFAGSVYYDDNTFDTLDGRGIVNGSLDRNGGFSSTIGGALLSTPVSTLSITWVSDQLNLGIALLGLSDLTDITSVVDQRIINTGSATSGVLTLVSQASDIAGFIFAADGGNGTFASYGITTITFGDSMDAVPVPAAGLLLISALGGFSAFRRRA